MRSLLLHVISNTARKTKKPKQYEKKNLEKLIELPFFFVSRAQLFPQHFTFHISMLFNLYFLHPCFVFFCLFVVVRCLGCFSFCRSFFISSRFFSLVAQKSALIYLKFNSFFISNLKFLIINQAMSIERHIERDERRQGENNMCDREREGGGGGVENEEWATTISWFGKTLAYIQTRQFYCVFVQFESAHTTHGTEYRKESITSVRNSQSFIIWKYMRQIDKHSDTSRKNGTNLKEAQTGSQQTA